MVDAGSPVAARLPSKSAVPDAGPSAIDGGVAQAAAVDGGPAAVQPIELPRASLAAVLDTWEDRRKAVQAHNPRAQTTAEATLQQEREELGIRDLTTMAAALDHEAARRLEAKDPQEANRLADLAVALAPDAPAPRFAKAQIRLASDLSSAGDAAGALRDGLVRAASNPVTRLALLGNLAAAAGIGLALAAVLALLALGLRPMRYALHDFHHLFPRGALPAQTAVLFVLVLLLPWALKLGPIAELTLLATASFLYLRNAERVVVTVLLVLLAAIPTLAGMGGPAATYAGSMAWQLERVEEGGPDAAPAVAQLEQLEQSNHADFPVLFVLGLDAKRAGKYDRAIDLYRHALALNPRSAEAQNDLANALLLKGDLDGARDAYLRASELAADSAVVAYNLAKVSTRRSQILLGTRDVSDDIERGKSAARTVYLLDRGLMDRPQDNRANLYLLDLELPATDLAGHDAHPVEAAITQQLRTVIWGSFAPSASMGVVFALLAGFWVLGLASNKLKPCFECTRCGRPVCSRCDREVAGGALCGQCHNAFVKKGAVDPSTRLKKEASAKRYQERWAKARRLASYLVAGLGHLLAGRPVLGIVFLLLGLMGGAAVAIGEGFFRPPLGGSMALAREILGAVLLVVVWFLSIRSYRSGEQGRV